MGFLDIANKFSWPLHSSECVHWHLNQRGGPLWLLHIVYRHSWFLSSVVQIIAMNKFEFSDLITWCCDYSLLLWPRLWFLQDLRRAGPTAKPKARLLLPLQPQQLQLRQSLSEQYVFLTFNQSNSYIDSPLGRSRIHSKTIDSRCWWCSWWECPSSVNAEPSLMTTEFRFYPQNHSVARSDYKSPCIPYEDTGINKQGFWSGFHPLAVVLSDVRRFPFRHR